MKGQEKLANALNEGFVNTYMGESKEWMDQVNEDAIYQELQNHEFEEFVRKVEAEGLLLNPYRQAV